MDWSLLGVLIVPLLVLANAFFVAAEFALVAVRESRVNEMVMQRRLGAHAVKHAIENLDDAIAATQLGITLASLALGWVGEPSLAHLFEPLFSFLPEEGSWIAAHTLATILAFVLITFMHVILGELAPKAVALTAPRRGQPVGCSPIVVVQPRDAAGHLADERAGQRCGAAGRFQADQRARDGAFGGRAWAYHRGDAPRRTDSARSCRVRAQRVSHAGQARCAIAWFRATRWPPSSCTCPRNASSTKFVKEPIPACRSTTPRWTISWAS